GEVPRPPRTDAAQRGHVRTVDLRGMNLSPDPLESRDPPVQVVAPRRDGGRVDRSRARSDQDLDAFPREESLLDELPQHADLVGAARTAAGKDEGRALGLRRPHRPIRIRPSTTIAP